MAGRAWMAASSNVCQIRPSPWRWWGRAERWAVVSAVEGIEEDARCPRERRTSPLEAVQRPTMVEDGEASKADTGEWWVSAFETVVGEVEEAILWARREWKAGGAVADVSNV